MNNPDIVKNIVALLVLIILDIGMLQIIQGTINFLRERARELIGLAFVLELAGFTWLVYTVFEYMGL